MLIKCPECELQVSDKAINCPHCGYLISGTEKQQRRPRQSHRKRLPNGFGQITEIKGKGLRKPFRAMVTIGKTEEGKPIQRLLKPESYFETYNDAYMALVEYNRNPYDFSNNITMNELYLRWSAQHFKKLKSQDSANNIISLWKHCAGIYDIKVIDIRIRHMKIMLETIDTTTINKQKIKTILNMMLDYAVEYEIIEHNYAKDFKLADKRVVNPDAHHTFTENEMNIIWEHQGESIWVDMIIIQAYTGWRPTELCSLEKQNIDMDSRCMIGGSKTEAGINRKVPIHSKIYHIVEKYMESPEERFLFGNLTYGVYRKGFIDELSRIGLNEHTPHDCRVRFVTEAKNCGMDEYAIKLIVGHSIKDLTERVYTKRNFEWLASEMKKLR